MPIPGRIVQYLTPCACLAIVMLGLVPSTYLTSRRNGRWPVLGIRGIAPVASAPSKHAARWILGTSPRKTKGRALADRYQRGRRQSSPESEKAGNGPNHSEFNVMLSNQKTLTGQ